VGHRYRGIGKAPEFMFLYETSNSKVLRSEAYLNRLNNPTPWTQQALAHFKNSFRTIYTLLTSTGKRPSIVGPYILACKFDCESGEEQKIIQWFRGEYLPQISLVQGVYRSRLYESVPELSYIQTEERKIHGMGPSVQRFLTLYEISSLDLLTNKAWEKIYMGNKQNNKLQKQIKNIQQELYWLHFVMYAPHTK